MVVTLTVNPAIDRNIEVDRLVFDDRAYIQSQSDSAGGRGIIASRVLASLGSQTLAIMTSGGSTGKRLETLLRSEGFPFEAVRIEAEIRTNFTIIDRQGLTIKLNEVGPPMTDAELEQVERAVASKMGSATWLMLCGSLPPEVDTSFYCKLIRLAKEHGVKTLLDTDGEALARSIEEGPTVVKPNQQEAERLLNRALITRAHFLDAASRMKAMGPETVILSLGSRGAVATDGAQIVEALPPRVDVLSPIGSGDAMSAAFVWATNQKKKLPEALRWAVAEATASAKLPGMQSATLDQTKEVYRGVEVRVQ